MPVAIALGHRRFIPFPVVPQAGVPGGGPLRDGAAPAGHAGSSESRPGPGGLHAAPAAPPGRGLVPGVGQGLGEVRGQPLLVVTAGSPFAAQPSTQTHAPPAPPPPPASQAASTGRLLPQARLFARARACAARSDRHRCDWCGGLADHRRLLPTTSVMACLLYWVLCNVLRHLTLSCITVVQSHLPPAKEGINAALLLLLPRRSRHLFTAGTR